MGYSSNIIRKVVDILSEATQIKELIEEDPLYDDSITKFVA